MVGVGKSQPVGEIGHQILGKGGRSCGWRERGRGSRLNVLRVSMGGGPPFVIKPIGGCLEGAQLKGVYRGGDLDQPENVPGMSRTIDTLELYQPAF